LIGNAMLEDVIIKTAIPTLDVAPAKQDLIAVEMELIDEIDRAERLARVLGDAFSRGAKYQQVIVDCPPSLGLLTLNALVAAERVMVPMQAEYFPLEGLSYLMDTLDRVRTGLNSKLELDGVLLTMYDPRNNLSKQVSDEVKRHFRVYEAIIPRNVRLSEAPSHGKPIVLYDAKSKGSESYLSLAREYLESIGHRTKKSTKRVVSKKP
jgi:chromosome partitioning protein